MSGKWMTYDELVASGWQEGETVVVRTYMHRGYSNGMTNDPEVHAKSRLYDCVLFLRLPKEDWETKCRYAVENSTIAIGAYDVLALNDRLQDSRMVAHSIPTREAAERIAAIYEGVA